MFAEFSRVSVFGVAKRCSVVSVSCLEVIFCIKSDVCFSRVVFQARDSSLTDD